MPSAVPMSVRTEKVTPTSEDHKLHLTDIAKSINTMEAWAVVETGKPCEKIYRDLPTPTGTEVLIRVTHAGVCHSDLHNWEGFYDLGHGQKLRITDRVKLPMVMGHEILGTVEDIGSDVQGLQKGDSRVLFPWLGCGTCIKCTTGEDNMCLKQSAFGVMRWGGFGSHVLVPHPKFLVDYGNVDPVVACTFGCSGLTVMNATKKLVPIEPEAYVVLIGAGGLGLTAVEMLKSLQHSRIISVDIDDMKLAAAKKAGATHTVNSKTSNAIEEIQKIVNGPVLNIIDFVANTQTATLANTLLGKGGKFVIVGAMGGILEISLITMIFRGATIYGNTTGNLQHLNDVVELAKAGKLAPLPVSITDWNNVNEALTQLKDGKVTGRLVLVRQ